MTADSTVPPSPTSETVLTVAAFGEREKVGSGGWEAHA